MKKYEYGFLFEIFKNLMKVIYYLNLVEFFKWIARKIKKCNKRDKDYKKINNKAIDIFILSKWLFIILIWVFNINTVYVTSIVIYLITTNLYTYFYYHVWDKESENLESFTIDRLRNRFKNLIQAFCFSIFSFAYLYQIPFAEHYKWPSNLSSFFQSVLFSSANSLTANYDGIVPNDIIGNYISISQILITFVFVATIFTKSIPQTNSKK